MNPKEFYKSLLLFITILLLIVFIPHRVHSATIMDNWSQTITTPENIASNYTTVYNNRIYSISGATSSVFSSGFYSSEINLDGTINSWSTLSSRPVARYWHSGARYNNFIYLLGGIVNSSNSSSVLLGKIDQNTGDITSWETQFNLPQALSFGSATIVGNNLYYAGGNPFPSESASASTNQNIYVANIDSQTGSLSAWTTGSVAGTLPEKLIGFSMIEINNYLYIFGGKGVNGVTSEVRRSLINSDGTISTNWENLLPIPHASYRSGVTRVGNEIVVAGGREQGEGIIDNVYYAEIDLNGSISNWQIGPSLTSSLCCTPLINNNNYIYLVGGHNGSIYTNTVNFSKISVSLPPSPIPTPTPTPIPTFGPFELPFGYEGRPATDSATFVNEFWNKATSLFDHSFVVGLFTPFTGNSVNSTNTPCSIPLNCYDTHNGTDFDDLNTDGFAYSVTNGVVVYKSNLTGTNGCLDDTTGYGCMVLVRYPGNIYGLYAHLQDINVSEGQSVTQTTKIGTIGDTGNSSGTHLHFGVLKPVNDKLVSPTILSMKRKDWHGLLQEISATSKNRLKAYCTYRSPNGISFEFIDPSGWRGTTKDPWSLPKNKDGCGVTSKYLWKFQI